MKKLTLLLSFSFFIFHFSLTSAQYKITTVAGTGTASYSGDGGQAATATMDQPWGITTDASGNIYIADQQNCRIRKITVSTGVITTIAGNGTRGFSGDNGLAASAQLCYPTGVAIDNSNGTIYIADCGNNRIRAVASGFITTVAGSTRGYSGDGHLATAACLAGPSGVAVDASHNIYIADSANNVIREVSASTGNISTIAGNHTAGFSGDGSLATAAELWSPFGVAVDGNDNVYIADAVNNKIRLVTVSTGDISTFAGNGIGSWSGDGGQATAAELFYPYGVTLDTHGNVYIADYFNERVRMVATGGVISTFAGDGNSGFSGDGGSPTSAEIDLIAGVAIDPAGYLLIASINESRIRQVSSTAGINEVSASNLEMKVYPNPNSGIFTIQLPLGNGQMSAEVYNMLGEKVYNNSLRINNGQSSIDLSGEPSGIYILKVQTENGKIYTSKVNINQ